MLENKNKNKSRVTVWVTARNVVNTDAIKTKLKVASARAMYQKGKQWVLRNVYNYLINDYTSRLGVEQVKNISDLKAVFGSTSKIPKWALDALEKDEELYTIEPDRQFWAQTLSHIVDFLNTQDRDWSRVSFPQMEKLVSDWDKQLKKQKQGKVNKEDYKHLFNSGSYQWVEILTPEGLKDEGAKMGHCVGGKSYCLNLQKGSIKIFSLRDKNFDNPHVTIRISKGNAIKEIQGKGNTPPIKYREEVIDFLTKMPELKIKNDDTLRLPDMGIFIIKGKIYTEDTLPQQFVWADLDSGSYQVATETPNAIKGKDIILDYRSRGESIYLKLLELARSVTANPNVGEVFLHITKDTNYLPEVIGKLRAKDIDIDDGRMDSGPIKIPSDLSRFNVFFSETSWGGGFDIPNYFKAKSVTVKTDNQDHSNLCKRLDELGLKYTVRRRRG